MDNSNLTYCSVESSKNSHQRKVANQTGRRLQIAHMLIIGTVILAGFAVLGPVKAATLGPGPGNVTVAANQVPFVDSSLTVASGSRVDINASGVASYGVEGQPYCKGSTATTPDGARSAGGKPCGVKIDPHATLPTAPIGALLASIGVPGQTCSTGWFFVGTHLSSTFDASGELYLLYNDSVGAYGNNSGSYTAKVQVTKPASSHNGGACNKIVDLQLQQTTKTPLWKLNLIATLNTANIACPATVTVESAGISTYASACNGNVAQAKVSLLMPVFVGHHQLSPGVDNAFKVTVTDSKGHDQLNKNLSIPQAPTWIGMGDSYSSGHNQTLSSWTCQTESLACHVTMNEPSNSWVTQAPTYLNAAFNVPPAWKMKSHMLAQSGATTNQVVQQEGDMANDLTKGQNSWNIVSITGGADDIGFAGILMRFYTLSAVSFNHTLPWAVTNRQECPDATSLYLATVQDASQIISNLDSVLSNARSTDPYVRLVDVSYPYVVNDNNICFNTQSQSDIGSKDLIDALDNLHQAADGSIDGVVSIDLRKIFGSTPLDHIQETYFFGYPHPNVGGQIVIAQAASQAVKQA